MEAGGADALRDGEGRDAEVVQRRGLAQRRVDEVELPPLDVLLRDRRRLGVEPPLRLGPVEEEV